VTKTHAAFFLAASIVFCLCGCAKESAPHAVAPKDAATDVGVDAYTAPMAPIDAGASAPTPRDMLRIGSTDPASNVFEVDTAGGTWLDLASEAPRRRRCDFLGDVLGVSANGRVALRGAADVTIVDLTKSCDAVKTSIKIDPLVEAWNGSASTNALSDDGSRIAIAIADDVSDANVYAVATGQRLFACTTHPAAGGPSTDYGISGDGRSMIWTHGREGTWVADLDKCSDDRDTDIASSPSYSALVSPHRKFLVECPFHTWGVDQPIRGFTAHVIGKKKAFAFAQDAFAADDFDFCSRHKSAFSPDDALLAFEDGFRVRIYSLVTRGEHTQIGESTLKHAMSGEIRALSFAQTGNTLLVASDTQIVRVDLRAYAAYEHAPLATIDEEMSLSERAFTTVELDDPK
jgi:hypothetical protein